MPPSSTFNPEVLWRIQFPAFPYERIGIKNHFLKYFWLQMERKRMADLLLMCCVSFLPSDLSRIVKWFWAVSKEKSTCQQRAAATNSLWTCDLEWIMNSASCTPLFPRKQTGVTETWLAKPFCFHCHHTLSLLSLICQDSAKVSPSPPSRHTSVWTGSRCKLADSSKLQRVYYLN